MSKICLFVLQRAKEQNYEIVSKIELFLRKHSLFLFWDTTYQEPFFDSIDRNDSIILSIADDSLYDNCDYLLLPDNCSINGLENPTPFLKRMKIIQDVIQEMSKYCSSMELFIADSGCGYDEYEECQINIRDFVDHAKRLNSPNSPDMHYIFTLDNGTLRDKSKGTVLLSPDAPAE